VNHKLVTKYLADAGYDCGLIGKLHLASAYGRIEPRINDGYSFWEYSHAPRDDWPKGHGYADWVRKKGFVLGDLIKSPAGVPPELHQTTWCAEKTIEFIRKQRSGPWMASVNIYDPHPPFNPPSCYRDRFDPQKMPGPLFRDSDLNQQAALESVDFQSKVRNPHELDIRDPQYPGRGRSADGKELQAAYYAMIKLIDDQVGNIIAALESDGIRDDTVIIFTSDHGEMLGDHGLIQKGCRFYEGLVRVPLIISWPEKFLTGVRSDALVELIDKAPTILDLAGIDLPEKMQGQSLLAILRGEKQLNRHRDYVRCEYYDALDEPDSSFATMFRDERYKLVVYHGHDLGELYDLQEDPEEFENMWSEYEAQPLKLDLLRRSFDASMFALDCGSERIGPM
jgi:arylsulfatase A-like enzyme